MSIQKTTTELETLKINYLTQEMYEAALENDEINSNELYFTPDTNELKMLVIELESFSSLPQTVTNSAITADHVCTGIELGKPWAQGDWTITTSDGSLVISGSVSEATTATLYLEIKQ